MSSEKLLTKPIGKRRKAVATRPRVVRRVPNTLPDRATDAVFEKFAPLVTAEAVLAFFGNRTPDPITELIMENIRVHRAEEKREAKAEEAE